MSLPPDEFTAWERLRAKARNLPPRERDAAILEGIKELPEHLQGVALAAYNLGVTIGNGEAEQMKSASVILMLLLVLAFLACIAMVVGGIYLTYLGATGETDLVIFGTRVSSATVGVPALVIGAVVIVILGRRALDSLDRLIGRSKGP